ncbi:hypothetical protein SUDANB176_00257 [Streptomyces sp. enrichment culture]
MGAPAPPASTTGASAASAALPRAATPTARMLPRLVTGRHEGALPAAFLTPADPVDSQTLSGLIGARARAGCCSS